MATSDKLRAFSPNNVRVMQIDVTTNASGVGSGSFPKCTGYLHSIRYIPHGTTPYDATLDVTITNATTGQGIWTQSDVTAAVTKFPRFVPDSLVGVALAALAVAERVFMNNEQISVAIAQGGNTKTGSFEAVILSE